MRSVFQYLAGLVLTVSYGMPALTCDKYFVPEYYPIGRGFQPYLMNAKTGWWVKVLPPTNTSHRSIVLVHYQFLKMFGDNFAEIHKKNPFNAGLYEKVDLKCDNYDNGWILTRDAGTADNPYSGFEKGSPIWKKLDTKSRVVSEFKLIMGCRIIKRMETFKVTWLEDDTYYSPSWGKFTFESDKCEKVIL